MDMEYTDYLELLRGVPKHVIQSAARRDFDMNDPNRCVAGWVLREAVARLRDQSVHDVDVADLDIDVPTECAGMFGGTAEAWRGLYHGVTEDDELPTIELAFQQALREARA